MRRYVLPGLLVLGVVVILALIARKLEWEEYTVPASLQGEAARNPFYAAERFARSLGARTEWRTVLGDLPPPPSVLVLQYWHWDLIASRRSAIEGWVEAGGRLVIDARLRDDNAALSAWTGLSRQYPEWTELEEDDDGDAAEATEASGPAATASDEVCRSLAVVRDVRGISEGHERYRVCTPWASGWLVSEREPLWSLADRDGLQAVRVALGRGSVTWVNAVAIFGNRELVQAEHGLLFVAMTELRPGDQLIFVSETGQPSLLSLIFQQGAAVVVLAGLALLVFLWRSSVRFGPPAAVPDLARRSLVEQIRGTGLFIRRVDAGAALHRAAVRALHEAAQRHIPRWSSLTPAERVLVLARSVGSSDAEINDSLHEGPRSSHELGRALEQLERVRRRLIAGDTAHAR